MKIYILIIIGLLLSGCTFGKHQGFTAEEWEDKLYIEHSKYLEQYKERLELLEKYTTLQEEHKELVNQTKEEVVISPPIPVQVIEEDCITKTLEEFNEEAKAFTIKAEAEGVSNIGITNTIKWKYQQFLDQKTLYCDK